MHYLIGTDEAGYGPNLGPLVITATVWKVPDAVSHQGMYSALTEVVKPHRRDTTDPRLCIADSKLLYKPGGGLAPIERSVLAVLQSLDHSGIPTWQSAWRSLCPLDQPHLERLPWYEGFDESLPIDACEMEIADASGQWNAGLAQAGVELIQVQSRSVFADCFNRLLLQYGNKSSVLSVVTIELIRQQIERLGDGDVFVLCDKHGGRNRYGALLQHAFQDVFVEVRGESRGSSHYRFEFDGRQTEFCFQAKADHILAAAMSSMVSKYLRELAMRAFNSFWRRKYDQSLKPTAGYPLDARRFKAQIAATQSGLGIHDDVLWRQR